MTSNLSAFLSTDHDWLAQLAAYQQKTVTELLAAGLDEESAAAAWLAGNPEDLATFGASQTMSLFYKKFVDEVHALLCSRERYEVERAEIEKQLQLGQTSAVALISATVGSHLGASGVYLGPAIALVLTLIGKLGLNAWCAMLEERERAEATLNNGAEKPPSSESAT